MSILFKLFFWLVRAKHGSFQIIENVDLVDDVIKKLPKARGPYHAFTIEKGSIVYSMHGHWVQLFIHNPISNLLSWVGTGSAGIRINSGEKNTVQFLPRTQFIMVNVSIIVIFALFFLFVLVNNYEGHSLGGYILSIIAGIPFIISVIWLRLKSARIMRIGAKDLQEIESFLLENGVTIEW